MITVYIDDPEQAIIRLDYTNSLESWAEYRMAVDQSNALAIDMDVECFIIHNGRDTKMPDAMDAIDELKQTVHSTPSNVAMLISVIALPVERRITEITAGLTVKPSTLLIEAVDSLDDAYKLITHYKSLMAHN